MSISLFFTAWKFARLRIWFYDLKTWKRAEIPAESFTAFLWVITFSQQAKFQRFEEKWSSPWFECPYCCRDQYYQFLVLRNDQIDISGAGNFLSVDRTRGRNYTIKTDVSSNFLIFFIRFSFWMIFSSYFKRDFDWTVCVWHFETTDNWCSSQKRNIGF